MKILFIQTGGTIDKDYPKVWQAYEFEITTPATERILEVARPTFEYRHISVCQKDSMDMTDEDRQALLEACRNAEEDRIVITHGTDTMRQSAAVLSRLTEKTIVLTGARLPERMQQSDAAFNVGVAIGALQCLSPGVYVAMNGTVVTWDRVQKNPETGQFLVSK